MKGEGEAHRNLQEQPSPGKLRLDVLERKRSRKLFNLGDHEVEVTSERVVIRGKTSKEWGRERVLRRAGIRASASLVSKAPFILLCIAYLLYVLAYEMIFVADGIAVQTQLTLFAVALLLLLTPFILYLLLPAAMFLIGAAAFFVTAFSFPQLAYLRMTFEIVQSAVGKGYVEAFMIAASMLPVLLHLVVTETVVRYRVTLEDGSMRFETVASGRSALALVRHTSSGRMANDEGFALRRFLEFKLPLYFLRLSKARMKTCTYCEEKTLVECSRCHAPVCASHFEVLRGYKVCLDCFVERRGKLRDGLRRAAR